MKSGSLPREAYFYSIKDDNPELIVCGQDYFKMVKDSFMQAKSSILICGWSFNLNAVMDDQETTLEEVLFSLPETVQVKILIWDYPIFYMADRDPFLSLSLALKHRKNISFKRFDFHPVMSSMHAKMVVVDKKTLYVGGIDLDVDRRDGAYNRYRDPLRRNGDGTYYQPFRDYAFKFEGQWTSHFAEFFDQLWDSQDEQRSEIAPRLQSGDNDNIFFGRTVPKFKDNHKETSSFKMHLWLIQNARKYIYIENQYLTSGKIIDLLIERLSEPNGPEVVIVVSYGKMPFIEKVSMGALLTDYVKKLLKNNPHQRLKIYTLFTSSDGEREFVKIHSKCVLVDDFYLKIGSSNINNRSMEFDYELDALVAGPQARAYKEKILKTLLSNGESVNIESSIINTFEKAKELHGKLVEVKDVLRKESPIIEYKDYLPLDKSEMTFFERIGQTILTKKRWLRINNKFLWGGVLLLIIVFAGAFIQPEDADYALNLFIAEFDIESPRTLMAIFFFAYLVMGSFLFPLNAYIFLCGAYFQMTSAFLLAMGGALGTASLSYGIGALFGKNIHAESRIEKIRQLQKLLKKNSLLTLIFLRMVPVAPFPLVNLVCGKFKVGFGKYILGTLIGIAPGAVALIFLEKQLIELFRSPSPENVLITISILVVFFFALRFLRKRMSA